MHVARGACMCMMHDRSLRGLFLDDTRSLAAEAE